MRTDSQICTSGRQLLVRILLALFVSILGPSACRDPQGSQPRSSVEPTVRRPKAMAKAALPLRYEENKGQFPKEVAFFSRTENYSVAIGPTEATFLLKAAGRPDGRAQLSDPSLPSIVRMRFEGSRKGASITGEEKLPGATHYFLGADPAAWRQDVRGYGKVRARQLYPGVDVLYKETDRRLEWDFIVAPGADIERIRLAFDGAERVQVTP